MAKGSVPYAVAQTRHSALDGLDYFPTPPWATRALLEWLEANVASHFPSCSCWEPAAGGRHMSMVLAETFKVVWSTDVHDYGGLDGVGSFVGVGPDVVETPRLRSWFGGVDWVITNPPFNLAEEFLKRALNVAGSGVALLLRSAWIEGIGRWESVFSRTPPTNVLQFAERVPMVKGRWDPSASTATPYAWFVWNRSRTGPETRLHWIEPKASVRCFRPTDVEFFAGERAKTSEKMVTK